MALSQLCAPLLDGIAAPLLDGSVIDREVALAVAGAESRVWGSASGSISSLITSQTADANDERDSSGRYDDDDGVGDVDDENDGGGGGGGGGGGDDDDGGGGDDDDDDDAVRVFSAQLSCAVMDVEMPCEMPIAMHGDDDDAAQEESMDMRMMQEHLQPDMQVGTMESADEMLSCWMAAA